MVTMWKRTVAASSALLLSAALLAGCGSQSASAPAPAADAKPAASQKVEIKPGERVKVTFWHAMGGHNGEVVKALADKFNASQDKVQVDAVYQGTYDQALQKLKAAGPAGPTLMQVYEIGSRFMIDSGMITPMQKFVDADSFKTDDFEQNILAYYTMDGKLNSMPFNTSNPIVYYNKTAFKEAGLDPNAPPATFDDFHATAKKLTKKTGTDTRYGAAVAQYGWFFEQLLATQNATYVDNSNGRSAKATKAVIDGKEGQNVLDWMKAMVDDGSAANLGRKSDDTTKAFAAGQIAMTIDSTASLSGILKSVGDKFEVGTAFMPHPQGVENGVIIGGASLWITNLKPEKEQWAAWEFVKWLASPEVQAEWSSSTGYFPIRKAAYDQQILKDWYAQRPQFKTAVDQLHATKINPATQGAVIGVFPQARQTVEAAMESVVLGKQTSQAALQQAAADITKAIADYNATTK